MLGKNICVCHRGALAAVWSCSFTFCTVWLLLFVFSQPAHAAVIETGDISKIAIGDRSYGRLMITEGSSVHWVGAYVGHKSTATGRLIIDGAGSLLDGTGVCVGYYGKGTLDITNGGSLDMTGVSMGFKPGSRGDAIVDGDGTTLFATGVTVGRAGEGTMDITGGAKVKVTSALIGQEPGSLGEATLGGSGSQLIGNTMYIGYAGKGKLNIVNGAEAKIRGRIGYKSGSVGEVTVDGSGSTWSASTCYVGYSGDGILNITGGGAVRGWARIGYKSGSTGKVTVDGRGSIWYGSMVVGANGDGDLYITDGGTVQISGTLTVNEDGIGDDFINMCGGKLALFGDADESLDEFLDLISGSDAIRYWDDSLDGWADIKCATRDEDYTLCYHNGGELAGYTVLSVGVVPEPSALVGLLGMAVAGLLARGVSKSQRNRPAARA